MDMDLGLSTHNRSGEIADRRDKRRARGKVCLDRVIHIMRRGQRNQKKHQSGTEKARENKHGFADTSQARIYYEISGRRDGVPVLMLHGNAEDHRVFRYYERHLRGQFRVILMDSRAHGSSRLFSSETAEFSTADMARDASELLRVLGIERCVLLGFSDGANIALEFAVRYPAQTLGVIAVSGNAQPAGMRLLFRAFAALQYWSSMAAYAAGRRIVGRAGGCKSSEKGHVPENCRRSSWCGKLLDDWWLSIRRRHMQAALLHRSPMLTGEQLALVKAPVLLIAGTLDLVKVSHTKWMARAIPDSRLVLLEGGTHGAFFKKKRLYLRLICGFLRETRMKAFPS